MLNAIRSYISPLPPLLTVEAIPTQPVSPPLDAAEIQRRLAAIKDRAEEYLVAMHIPTEEEKRDLEELLVNYPSERFRKDMTRSTYNCIVTVKIDPTKSDDFAATRVEEGKKTIYIHPLMLLKPTDLPKDLAFAGKDAHSFLFDKFYQPFMSEPAHRFIEPGYIERLVKWINEKCDLKENQLEDDFSFSILFQTYYKFLWKNDDTFSHIKDFIIAHEVAHLHYKHSYPRWHLFVILGVTVSIPIILWIYTSLLAVLFGTVAVFQISRLTFKWLAYKLHGIKENEKMADLIAMRVVKTIEGAETCFETAHKVYEFYKKAFGWPIRILEFLIEPVDFIPICHPTPKERIAYLKEALAFEKNKAPHSLPQPLKA